MADSVTQILKSGPPGTKLNFLSFDHTTGRLVIEGTATVSADGKYVTQVSVPAAHASQ